MIEQHYVERSAKATRAEPSAPSSSMEVGSDVVTTRPGGPGLSDIGDEELTRYRSRSRPDGAG